MNSLLTNNSAMVALETLRGINKDLASVQSQISTGKEVSNAKDNAAVWAISTVMSTDVESFKQINDSLNKGSATVGVARNAAESVTGLLQDMKELVVSAQEDLNADDRSRIQTDIAAKRDQITNIVSAAQFNGVNLVQGNDEVNFLASLDRNSDGTVSTSNITVDRQDLSSSAGVFGSGTTLATNITTSGDGDIDSTGADRSLDLAYVQTAADTDDVSLTINGTTITQSFDTDETTTMAALADQVNALGLTGITASESSGTLSLLNANSFDEFDVGFTAGGTNTFAVTNNGDTGENAAASAAAGTATLTQRAESVSLSTTANVNEGDSYRVSVGGTGYDYVAGKGETMQDVARGLKTAIDGASLDGVSTNVSFDDASGAWSVGVDYDGTGASGASIAITDTGQAGGTASGGLFGLANIDVSTSSDASAALNNIETLLGNSISAAASFGSDQGRIESQSEFITQLADSLTSGIGTLVDADLEAASARLQALQVQQQLGTQALSIANQAPQSLLSLFR